MCIGVNDENGKAALDSEAYKCLEHLHLFVFFETKGMRK
jgi:hypothetical protein